jgi:hypothetical protein
MSRFLWNPKVRRWDPPSMWTEMRAKPTTANFCRLDSPYSGRTVKIWYLVFLVRILYRKPGCVASKQGPLKPSSIPLSLLPSWYLGSACWSFGVFYWHLSNFIRELFEPTSLKTWTDCEYLNTSLFCHWLFIFSNFYLRTVSSDMYDKYLDNYNVMIVRKYTEWLSKIYETCRDKYLVIFVLPTVHGEFDVHVSVHR